MWKAASTLTLRRTLLVSVAAVALIVAATPAATGAAIRTATHGSKSSKRGKSSSGASDTQAPSAPINVSVAGVTTTSLSLSWSASTDNVGVAGYDLYLNGSKVATTTATSYSFAGLVCGTSYTLAVDAYDAAGNRSLEASVAASTGACPDTQAPSAPSNLSLGAASTTSLSVSWSAGSDNVGVAGYDLFLNGSKLGTTSGTSYSFSGLACGSSYTLAVDAYDAAGNRSPQASVMASTTSCPDTVAPTTPGPLLETAAGASSVSLSWAPSLDNVGVVGYGVYVNGSRVGTTSFTSYTITNLGCGKSYTLAVDAYDAAGNRSPQASVLASTSACPDTQAPSAPSNLSLGGASTSSLPLSWSASTDNVGVAGYELFLNGSKLGTTGATSYTFSGLACGSSYTLAVDAYDAAGNRSARASRDASTSACATAGTGTKLSWAPPTCGDATHGCIDLQLTNTGANQTPSLSSSNDYRIHLPNVPLQGGLQIRGGRNVIIIGGEIDLTVPCSDASSACRGIYISRRNGPSGQIFIEGVWIHAPQQSTQSTSDGIAVDDSSSLPTDITLENDRIDGISGCEAGGNHSDIIQTWYAGNAHVNIDHFTGVSNCQGLQIDPDLAWAVDGTYAAGYDIRNTNLVSSSTNGRNDYLFWLTDGLACNSGPISLRNVYAQDALGKLSIEAAWPDTDQPAACTSLWNGSTLSFPSSPQITGVIANGRPPSGDFVPIGVAGIGYVSPGYQ
jgi:chitodextrinase